MEFSSDVEKFINLTLSLIHPDLFQCGLSMLQELRKLDSTRDIAQEWQPVYSGVAIISNRRTPAHRDSKGRAEWFDTLVSYSETGTTPRLFIQDIGIDFDYSGGTVVGLCGSVFQHEVKSWGIGDRVCYAHFMREAVRDRLNVPPAGWVNRVMYLPSQKQEDEDRMDVD